MRYDGKSLRHEFKYYINLKTYHILSERLKHVMKMDENTKNKDGYLIGSLYFDDMFNSVYNDKIRGTRFRKKFRIRAYDKSKDIIKLECKQKFDGFISKTSANLSISEYEDILNGNYDFLAFRKEKICLELLGYTKTLLLKPTTVVEYFREAYVADEGNVRITFDKKIQANVSHLDLFADDLALSPILPNDIIVLEVKYDDFLPAHIQKIIFEQKMQRQAISKFVMCKNKNWRVLHHD